jgi:hypothetical protein
MSFVPGHSRRDDRVIGQSDQEQLGLDCELSGNVLSRVIPQPNQTAPLPQSKDCRFILRPEYPDVHPQFQNIQRAAPAAADQSSPATVGCQRMLDVV